MLDQELVIMETITKRQDSRAVSIGYMALNVAGILCLPAL